MMGKDLGRDENGEKKVHGGQGLIPDGVKRDGVNGPTGQEPTKPMSNGGNGTLAIDRELYKAFKKFCDMRGWHLKFMATKALREWMREIEKMEESDE